MNNLSLSRFKILLFFVSFGLLCGTVGLTGCSSILKIQSEPSGADVYISQQNSTDRKSLGKTPIEIRYGDIRDKLGGSLSSSDMMIMTLEGQGLETAKVYVPPSSFGTTGINIKVRMTPQTEISNANNILQWLHNAQKFAQGGEFERAHIEADKVLTADPKFVRAMSMKGSIFYLQKNYNEAIKWFEKALVEDGSFEEAVIMLNKIKRERK